MADRRVDMGHVERLGFALANKRETAGLSRADLANAIGITEDELLQIERGQVDPPLTLMCELGSALGWVIR